MPVVLEEQEEPKILDSRPQVPLYPAHIVLDVRVDPRHANAAARRPEGHHAAKDEGGAAADAAEQGAAAVAVARVHAWKIICV